MEPKTTANTKAANKCKGRNSFIADSSPLTPAYSRGREWALTFTASYGAATVRERSTGELGIAALLQSRPESAPALRLNGKDGRRTLVKERIGE
jgi:hypothetical protein